MRERSCEKGVADDSKGFGLTVGRLELIAAEMGKSVRSETRTLVCYRGRCWRQESGVQVGWGQKLEIDAGVGA